MVAEPGQRRLPVAGTRLDVVEPAGHNVRNREHLRMGAGVAENVGAGHNEMQHGSR